MDIRQIVKNTSPVKDSIGAVKRTKENIETVRDTVDTARELAGVSKYEEIISKQEDTVRMEREKSDIYRDQLHTTEIQNLKENIENKLSQLQQGAAKPVAEVIKDIKEAANEIGLGKKDDGKVTDQIGDLRNTFELLSAINPHRSLGDQLQEFATIQDLLKPKEAPAPAAELPASVAIALQQMKQNHELAIEQLKDDRQDRSQKFELLLKKYDDDKTFRDMELRSKNMAEHERNNMLSGSLDKVGKIIARATMEEGAISARTGRVAAAAPEVKSVIAGRGESGSFPCSCGNTVLLAADAERAICSKCQQIYKVQREAVNDDEPFEDEATKEAVLE